MKRIIFWPFLMFLLTLTACEKEMMGYEGVEGVYFAVRRGEISNAYDKWPYHPYTNVEFLRTTENEIDLEIKVMITGATKDYDRTFKVVIDPDSTTAQLGIHYKILANEFIIPANSVESYVPITVLRSAELKTESRKIGLKLVENENFKLSFPQWDAIPGMYEAGMVVIKKFDASFHTININDFMVQPAVWPGSILVGNKEAGSFGAFSRKKIELIFKLLNLTYEDFATSQKMPSTFSNLIAKECSRYLIEQFNLGTPVLEEDGRLMYFNGVPWVSIVGIKWVP